MEFASTAKAKTFGFSTRFVAKDKDGKIVRSWTIALCAPPDSGGGQAWSNFTTGMTFGLAGSSINHHYAGIWAREGNGATNVKDAYYNPKHQKNIGKDGGDRSGESRCYWQDWHTAIVELSDFWT